MMNQYVVVVVVSKYSLEKQHKIRKDKYNIILIYTHNVVVLQLSVETGILETVNFCVMDPTGA